MDTLRTAYAPALGRVLLSLIFVMAGIGKIGAPAGTKGYIASVGMPAPDLAYIAAVVIELGVGLALLVGFKARIAAVILAVFTVVATAFFHNQLGDQIQMIMFLKNLAIIGGLLLVFAYGAGSFALDNRGAGAKLATAR